MSDKSNNTLRAGTKPGVEIQFGSFTCIFCKETFEGDKKRICCDKPECQEKQHGMKKEGTRKSTKRYKQKKRTDNPCIICGKDNGINMFYCKTCHSRLSNEYVSEDYGTIIQL